MVETFGTVFVLVTFESGNKTKALNFGPVGGAVSRAAVGLATLNPVMGYCKGWPSKIPLRTGAAKKSSAFRTSYAVPTGSTELTLTPTLLAPAQL